MMVGSEKQSEYTTIFYFTTYFFPFMAPEAR